MVQAYTTFSTRKTSQQDIIPGHEADMAKNNAGGFAFAIDDWKRLDRFLILGSEGGTYYVNQPELTKRNAEGVMRCVTEDGIRTVNRIVEISHGGRAHKNDPALFALAMCAGVGNLETRKAALAALPKVARIGTHLFHFLTYVEQFRGWGRGLREAVSTWYNDKDADRLAYQIVKYRQRDGWTHRDVLRLAHPKATDETHNELYRWITKGEGGDADRELYGEAPILAGYMKVQSATSAKDAIKWITEYNLTREMIPTNFLNDPNVWAALLEKMPLNAMVRNLGKMTNVKLIQNSLDNAAKLVVQRLGNREYIHKSRLHPLAILVALKTYQQGHGMRGKLNWRPVASVVDALDEAFYLAFDNVKPTGKNIMLALDVSGSMSVSLNNLPISAREGSAAMALVTARVEKNRIFTIFSSAGTNFMPGGTYRGSGMSHIDISPRQRLDDVVRKVMGLPFGGTDCALPMLYAIENRIEIDTFIVYTDSETWAGDIHPVQALADYRNKFNPNAKLIVVGMTSSGFSIADPNDAGQLDVVGFSTDTPSVISNFMSDGI